MARSAFDELGIAPTLDAVAVKRAYFRALAAHPPHADAKAFRRVRTAFETLTRDGGLASAFIEEPVCVEKERKRLAASIGEALREARHARQAARDGQAMTDAFAHAVSVRTLDEARAWIRGASARASSD
ncbi:MAG: J domain-containing protein [Nannocystaceae bacterium]